MRAAAAAVIAVVGCGDGRSVVTDGSTADSYDVPVRLHVAAADGSNAGLRVFFQTADYTVVATTHTDANGDTNAFMPPGGFVTVERRTRELFTWGGVKPGDHLELGRTVAQPQVAIAEVSVPKDPDAASYWLHTSCAQPQEITGAEVAPTSVVLDTCAPGPADAMLVTRQLGFSTIAHVSPAVGITLGTIPAPSSVKLEGPLVPPSPSALTIENTPGSIQYIYAWQIVSSERGRLYDTSTINSKYQIDASTRSRKELAPLPMPEGTTLATYTEDQGSFSSTSRLSTVTWGPPTSESVVDLGALDVPAIVAFKEWLPASGLFRWVESERAIHGEAAIADVAFDGGLIWHTMGPRGADPELAIPPLPDPNLATGDSPPTILRIITVQSSVGYDAYRDVLLGIALSTGESWPTFGRQGHISHRELRGQ